VLYRALFEVLAGGDIHRIVAGITLPNAGSVALHERCGFRQIGVLSSVGPKFDRLLGRSMVRKTPEHLRIRGF
jgi:phosphinothricin acetyltransferase